MIFKITTQISIATGKSGAPVLAVTKTRLLGLTIYTRITQYMDGSNITK